MTAPAAGGGFSLFWEALAANRLALLGLAVVAALVLVATLAPWLAPFDPNAIDVRAILLPPSWTHPFGTDELGRDVFSRMIHGSRVSLQVGLVSAGLATLVGVALGAVAGYYGGWVEAAIMRFTDMMLCFPTFFLILAVIALLEPNILNIMAVIGLTSWMGVARLVRAEFLTLKEREFVLA
ncbi:MAG: ABC transporter permease, partial [Desulfarculus sp.]|nr:ABC transporter permease [Desulfarculus sp.]